MSGLKCPNCGLCNGPDEHGECPDCGRGFPHPAPMIPSPNASEVERVKWGVQFSNCPPFAEIYEGSYHRPRQRSIALVEFPSAKEKQKHGKEFTAIVKAHNAALEATPNARVVELEEFAADIRTRMATVELGDEPVLHVFDRCVAAALSNKG